MIYKCRRTQLQTKKNHETLQFCGNSTFFRPEKKVQKECPYGHYLPVRNLVSLGVLSYIIIKEESTVPL